LAYPKEHDVTYTHLGVPIVDVAKRLMAKALVLLIFNIIKVKRFPASSYPKKGQVSKNGLSVRLYF
jgi:hypothetical protein